MNEWADSQDNQIVLDNQGKIIDYIDPDVRRENTPEERIRQRITHVLNMEYNYPTNLIALEKQVQIGREIKRADIVVYNNPDSKAKNDQGNIFLIIETKAPTVKYPDGQLISYLSATSATGGFWTNGDSIVYYRKNLTDNSIIDWTGIPKYGESWDSIGYLKKTDLIVPVDLKLAFKRCHNAIYRTGINSENIALDMVRILLSKIEDESSADPDCKFRITPEEYADERLQSIACARVRKLFSNVRDRYPDVFKNDESITIPDKQLALVVNQLQGYAFLDSPYDVLGTAYETYVASNLKGDRGQYFTNRLVINMMVKMVDPDDKSFILDPACGSGGFLLTAMNYIFKKIDKSGRTPNAIEILKRNVVCQLFGVDIDPNLIKVAKANMLIGRDGHGGIEHANSLGQLTELSPKFHDQSGFGKPSVILTNPPFGSGADLKIKDKQILKNYKIGRMWDVDSKNNVVYSDRINEKQGVAPELLFLERTLQWVKEDGIIGIVMAKGQLDNKEAFAIRDLVTKESQILAVVNLHEDTFEPFCGSKASVIFLRKRSKIPSNYSIFMAISNKVGQTSRGEPIFKKNSTGDPIIIDGKQVLDEDLSDIADAYHEYLKGSFTENEYQFSIQYADLDKQSLSFNPVHYLPKHNEALRHIALLAEGDDFEIRTLGSIANVFNGPRFKRPYADLNVTEGPGIVKYYTGTALTQLKSENVKYLDKNKATKQQLKQLDELTIHSGYILISDSGTLGRITYALNEHEGVIATNNLIRVIIDDLNLRGYVYEFLRSDMGQKLILKNSYGTNQEHLEPADIANVPIPIPKNRELIDSIGSKVIESIKQLETSINNGRAANAMMADILLVEEKTEL